MAADSSQARQPTDLASPPGFAGMNCRHVGCVAGARRKRPSLVLGSYAGVGLPHDTSTKCRRRRQRQQQNNIRQTNPNLNVGSYNGTGTLFKHSEWAARLLRQRCALSPTPCSSVMLTYDIKVAGTVADRASGISVAPRESSARLRIRACACRVKRMFSHGRWHRDCTVASTPKHHCNTVSQQ